MEIRSDTGRQADWLDAGSQLLCINCRLLCYISGIRILLPSAALWGEYQNLNVIYTMNVGKNSSVAEDSFKTRPRYQGRAQALHIHTYLSESSTIYPKNGGAKFFEGHMGLLRYMAFCVTVPATHYMYSKSYASILFILRMYLCMKSMCTKLCSQY